MRSQAELRTEGKGWFVPMAVSRVFDQSSFFVRPSRPLHARVRASDRAREDPQAPILTPEIRRSLAWFPVDTETLVAARSFELIID